MLNIGEFARLGGVSVRMLRHYDALGLIVPEQVDAASGYRRYRASQLARLNRLVALKELGFSLDHVGSILDASPSAPELRSMLTLRRAQVNARIETDRARLVEIERRLRTIEKEGQMPEWEFTSKSLPGLRVAQIVSSVASQEQISGEIGPMFERLTTVLAAVGVRPAQPAVAWYSGDDSGGLQIGAAIPVGSVDPVPDGVELADLESEQHAITVIHNGGMETIGDTWQALARYVDDQGLSRTGRAREVYLSTPMDDPHAWVTELQQPVD